MNLIREHFAFTAMIQGQESLIAHNNSSQSHREVAAHLLVGPQFQASVTGEQK